MPRTLGTTAKRMMDVLPPYYENAYDARGVVQTVSQEIDRLDAEVAKLVGGSDGVAELFPLNSVDLLEEWERVLGLGSDPNKSVSQRQTVVQSVLRTLKSADSAESWRQTLLGLIGTGWSYSVDYGSYTINLYLPYGVQMTPPTSFAVSASGSAALFYESFESGVASWATDGTATSITLASDSTWASDGTLSAKLSSTNTSGLYARAYYGTFVNVSASTAYTVTADANVLTAPTGSSVRCELAWYTSANALISTSTGTAQTGTGTKALTLTATSPSTAAKVRVIVSQNGSTTSGAMSADFDNVVLVSGSTGGGTIATGTYYYAVTSVNAYGESNYAGGTTVALTQGQRASLSWSAPANGTPDKYYVYRGTSLTNMQRLTTTAITGTTFTDTGAYALAANLAPTSSTTLSDVAGTVLRIIRAVTPAHITVSSGYNAGFIMGVSKIGDVL